jgi:ubiquinone/menaquinone biosynthesis C-methylase UbiE
MNKQRKGGVPLIMKNMDVERKYARIARFYDFLDYPFEICRYRTLRREILLGLSGEILEAGVGTGRNLEFYPSAAKITGIDLSAAMLQQAHRRVVAKALPIHLLQMDVEALGFPDNRFDVVVSSFLFCVLHAPFPALTELSRVCRPEGKIILCEYCLSANPMRRFVQRLWAPWVRFAYGAEFDRNTAEKMKTAGYELLEERFVYHDILKIIVARPKKQFNYT